MRFMAFGGAAALALAGLLATSPLALAAAEGAASVEAAATPESGAAETATSDTADGHGGEAAEEGAAADDTPDAGAESTTDGTAGAGEAAVESVTDGDSTTDADSATDAEAEQSDATAEPAAAGDAKVDSHGYLIGDVVLGQADAPVTVVEYASFTCPHCGTFAKETFPQVRKDYVETGKVKFILREVYFDQYGLWASMVARCGGEKGFYPLAHRFLTTQESWSGAEDIGLAIHQIGRRAGLSADRLEQCLSDREFATELLAEYQKHAAEDDIQSTPTFIINGKKHGGAMSYEEFSKLLDAEL